MYYLILNLLGINSCRVHTSDHLHNLPENEYLQNITYKTGFLRGSKGVELIKLISNAVHKVTDTFILKNHKHK